MGRLGPSQLETFWTKLWRKRGLRRVISDAHEGVKASVAKVLH